jgi:hypothetical protein
MTIIQALSSIRNGLEEAERKFPSFPTDPVHAAAIVVEEAAVLQVAALQFTYKSGGWAALHDEAVQVGAMALRFLCHIDSMKSRPSEQVERVPGSTQHLQAASGCSSCRHYEYCVYNCRQAVVNGVSCWQPPAAMQ